MKLFDLLTLSSCSSPDRTAIIDRELKLSYRELRARVEILLGVLKKCRCTENTGVALVLDNCAEYFISFFAVSAAGGTIVPLSTRMAPPEVQAFVKKCDASFVITDEKYLKRLSLKTMRAADVTVLCIELNKKGELIIKNLFLRKNTTSEQDTSSALMVPTSGSTGQPKIVMLTDDQLISNMAVYQTAMGFHQHNVVFCALSFHHIYCICAQLLTHTSRADTFVISSKPFFIKDFLKAVREHSVTITAFVPYFAILLSEFDTPDYLTPLTLKYVTLSGAKTPRKIYKTLRNKYPWINFINTYGMSEAGSRISIAAPYFKEFPPDSVGKPMPGVQVKIMDVWGEYLPANRLVFCHS